VITTVTVMPFHDDHPPETQHPLMFCERTDRADYARAMVQELEDAAHNQMASPMLRVRLVDILNRWMTPVFRHHGISGAFKLEMAGGRASFNLMMWDGDAQLFKEREPVLAAAMQTPDGKCACEVTAGVRHEHGGNYAESP
jgi:hypothetical protein